MAGNVWLAWRYLIIAGRINVSPLPRHRRRIIMSSNGMAVISVALVLISGSSGGKKQRLYREGGRPSNL